MSRRKLDLERLRQHARDHAVAWHEVDLTGPIHSDRWFLCETQTPLYYADSYSELSVAEARRYNQLTGLSFNELISFFEINFAQYILGTLVGQDSERLPRQLVSALVDFAEEERHHTAAFRSLNRLCEPTWYDRTPHHILHIRRPLLAMLRAVTRRPALFPAVVWIALVMEEKSLATSRALLRAGDDVIEPHFLAVYRAHLEDEVRHVQLDWHLLDHLYTEAPTWLRRANARLFCFLLTRFFLSPASAGRRVLDLLVAEHPRLRPLFPRLVSDLEALSHDADYLRMMYSREVTPITFELFDRYPEFHPLGESLSSYRPATGPGP
ncbi:MAG: diiron oxygenase [Thermoanaerobaculia bacterium]|nr:diiron oxygenase [Thermoanaerobaculia bacterium]